MSSKKFSLREAICFAWSTVKNNVGLFVSLSIVSALSHASFLFIFFRPNPWLLLFLFLIFFTLLQIISIGIVKIALQFYYGEGAKFADLLCKFDLLYRCFWASIFLFLIAVGIGLLFYIPSLIFDAKWVMSLFTIPEYILGVRFMFVFHLILDKKVGPISALNQSYKITKDATWRLYIFGLIFLVTNRLGVFLAVALPFIIFVGMFIYHKLLEASSPDVLASIEAKAY